MLNPNVQSKIREKFGERARFQEKLAPYLAYRIGGPADVLVFPTSEEELTWLSGLARTEQLPVTIIGNGTNLLVVDAGLRGIVIALPQAFKEIELQESSKDRILVRVGGGCAKPDLLDWAVARGYGGLEFSAGVPGTIGGGIFMNAGTKYGCYADILRRIRLFDFKNGAREFEIDRTAFGYREQTVVADSLVLWTLFELKPADSHVLRTEVARIIAERAEKQPLDFPSCGSTFKNPEGFSAGRLIEKAGLKGLTRGGAEISLKHANFILNKGDAKASDVLELIGVIQQEVKKQFGLDLECEVIVLGGKRG